MNEEETLSQRVATFLKEKRMAMGYTQGQMALYLFNDKKRQSYISFIENGSRKLTVDTLGLILEKLNAKVEIIEF